MKRRAQTKAVLSILGVLLLIGLPLLGACSKEVVKEVPVEKVVEKEVVKEVPVQKVVTKEVLKEVPVEKVVEQEVVLPGALSFGGGSMGATSYAVAVAVSRIGQKATGVSMTPESTAGEVAIGHNMAKGTQELGVLITPALYTAARGLDPFHEVGKVPLRVMFAGHMNIYQWITIDPNIKTVQDAKGKTIMWKNPASIVHMNIMKAVWDYTEKNYGFGEKDITTAVRKSTDLVASEMTTGGIHIGTTLGAGGAAIVEVAITHKGKFHIVPFPKEMIDAILQSDPSLSRGILPKGTYEGYPPEDYHTVGAPFQIAALTNVPNVMIYTIMKALYDDIDEFRALLPKSVASEYSLQSATVDPKAPFHEGAIRYYKEKGVWTPELEKLQQKLLGEVK